MVCVFYVVGIYGRFRINLKINLSESFKIKRFYIKIWDFWFVGRRGNFW